MQDELRGLQQAWEAERIGPDAEALGVWGDVSYTSSEISSAAGDPTTPESDGDGDGAGADTTLGGWGDG